MNFLTMYALYSDGCPILHNHSPYQSTVSGTVPLFFELADAEAAKAEEKKKDPSRCYMVKEVKIQCTRLLVNN